MQHAPLVVEAAGAACAVGLGAPQIAAAVRGGIGRITNSHILDSRCEHFIYMGLVPDEALPDLSEDLDLDSARQARMVRLGAAALQQVAAGLTETDRRAPYALTEHRPEIRLEDGCAARAL